MMIEMMTKRCVIDDLLILVNTEIFDGTARYALLRLRFFLFAWFLSLLNFMLGSRRRLQALF